VTIDLEEGEIAYILDYLGKEISPGAVADVSDYVYLIDFKEALLKKIAYQHKKQVYEK
jgi:hypothetical protein